MPDYTSLPYYIKYAANNFEEIPDTQSKKLTDFLPVRNSGTFNYLDLLSSATGAIPSYIINTVLRNSRNVGNK